jgi:hypothetical protein
LKLPLPLILFLAAAGVRLAAFLAFYIGSVLTGHHGLVDPYDPVITDQWAWFAAEHLLHGEWVNLTTKDHQGQWDVGFTYLVAAEYLVVGHHPEVARIVSVVLAAFSAPVVYIATRATSLGDRVARLAGWLTALWPLSIYWAGYDLIKDPLTWFLLSLAVLALTTRSRVRFVSLAAVSAVFMLLVRLYIGIGLYVLMPLSAALRRDWKALVGVVAVLAGAEASLLLAGFPPVWSIRPYEGNTISSAAVAVPPAQTSPIISAERLLERPLITVVGPRPAIRDVMRPTLDTGMYPGLFVWIALIPFTLLGMWRGLHVRDPAVVNLLLLAVGLWIGLAALFPGGFRQREMAFPVTLIFTSLGLQRPWPARWHWMVGGLFAIGGALLIVRELHVL